MKIKKIKTRCGMPFKNFDFCIDEENSESKEWYGGGESDPEGFLDYVSLELIYDYLFFVFRLDSYKLAQLNPSECIDLYKKLYLENKRKHVFDLIIDVGAHHGHFALNFADISEYVIAIEAYERNYEILKENIQINNLENVRCLHNFISSENKILSFSKNDWIRFNNDTIHSQEKSFTVNSIRLDDFYDRITENTLIKIDVEGEEVKVLEGCSKIIKDKVLNFVIELHDFSEDDHARIKEILNFNDYEIIKLTRNDAKLKVYRDGDSFSDISWLFLRGKSHEKKFPKTFCLSLKDYPERKIYAEKHLEDNGINAKMFEGINAKKFGLSTKIPYTDDHANWDKDCGTPHFISQGHVGCILSHYMLWRIMEYLPYGEYLILEDDVVLCENFKEKLLDVKSRLPEDWQYCFVGNCCLNKEDSLQIDDGIIQTVTPPLCTHAYMIKKSALKTLIDTNSIAWSHIDIQIQKRSLSNLNYYVLDPPLAEQLSITNPGEIFESLTHSY
jgi:FkbM family methyltransferase